MPLSQDETQVALAKDVVQGFDNVFGVHPGYRPAHAKGAYFTGTFTPSPEAAELTAAVHANQPSTPVIVRFSDATGLPNVPDNDSGTASPRGCAIRFQLGEHKHTDIVSHSHDGFPARTGEEFLEFLRAIAATNPSQPHPNAVEQFVGSHPAALAFVSAPKPIPTSFAHEGFFSVTAFKFINAKGEAHFGRYRVVPVAGREYLDDQAAAGKGPNFLFEEITERVAKEPVKFNIVVQIAEADDTVDDATVRWPDERRLVNFGQVVVTAKAAEDDPEMQRVIFDPIPRLEGIESSGDPLLETRANVYLLAGRRRREALAQAPAKG